MNLIQTLFGPFDDDSPDGPTKARAEADEIVESDVDGMVECLVEHNVTIRESDDPDKSCYEHDWADDPARVYEKPGPDMRNPIYLYECADCDAEKHEGKFRRVRHD